MTTSGTGRVCQGCWARSSLKISTLTSNSPRAPHFTSELAERGIDSDSSGGAQRASTKRSAAPEREAAKKPAGGGEAEPRLANAANSESGHRPPQQRTQPDTGGSHPRTRPTDRQGGRPSPPVAGERHGCRAEAKGEALSRRRRRLITLDFDLHRSRL